MDALCPANRVGPDFRKADSPDVARLPELGQAAGRFFDRDVRIEPARPVDVEVIDAERLQRVAEEVPRRGRTRVHAEPVAIRAAQGPELDREERLPGPVAQRAAD